jgi:hypothetical protein
MNTRPSSWSAWSGIIGHIGAAGGHVNCLDNGEIVITLPPAKAPDVPKPVQVIFNSLAVSQMAAGLPDDSSRRQVQEVALRLAHHAIVDLIDSVLA